MTSAMRRRHHCAHLCVAAVLGAAACLLPVLPVQASAAVPPPNAGVTDSAQSISPGQRLTYTLSIDTSGCIVSAVTDEIPAGFVFESANGTLGTPVVTPRLGTNAVNVGFISLLGYPQYQHLTETITVHAPPGIPTGVLYVNAISGTSLPPLLSGGCGPFAGRDPGVLVPIPAPVPAPVPAPLPVRVLVPVPVPVTLPITLPVPVSVAGQATPPAAAGSQTTPPPASPLVSPIQAAAASPPSPQGTPSCATPRGCYAPAYAQAGEYPSPTMSVTDSVLAASPGTAFSYTLHIEPRGCSVTSVTDMVPAGLTFRSASGALGDHPTVRPRYGTAATDVVFGNIADAPAGQPFTESITVMVSYAAATGVEYVDTAVGESTPPSGSSGCGGFSATDTGLLVAEAGASQQSSVKGTQVFLPPGRSPFTAADASSPLPPVSLALLVLLGGQRAGRRARRRCFVR